MKTVVYTLFALALSAGIDAAEADVSVKFDPLLISVDRQSQSISYSEYPGITTPKNVKLAAQTAFVELKNQETLRDLSYEVIRALPIDKRFRSGQVSQLTTSEGGIYSDVENRLAAALSLGDSPVLIDGELLVEGRRFARLMIFPVTLESHSGLILNEEIQIKKAGQILSPEQILGQGDLPSKEMEEFRQYHSPSGSSAAPEYLIVTSKRLADSFERLSQYKMSLGLRAAVHLIEDILSTQSGRDDAEKLRNYLFQMHADGTEYLLLAGDETVLPVRYAYHRSVSEMPSLELLQVCDLYFGDLTGDWDVDNDGIWGEAMHDRPDLTPELRVGRLPFNRIEEAENYINKLIRYETGSGQADLSYLQKAFFFSSDQMRDYGTDGQHGHIAKAYPENFEIDTTNGVENSSGADPNPINMPAAQLTSVLSAGYGIVNIIAHGRSDAFAVKTSGFNNWPKSYFQTGEESSGHGSFDSLEANGRTSFYYSLACDNGGFDLDQPPINRTNTNLAQRLLGLKDAGAVAFVAYSRWGWTSSSHLLQKTFFDSLFAHPDRPAVDAMHASKSVYYYYRDLNYGQNYYGDPSLRVFTGQPARLAIGLLSSKSGVRAVVTEDGQPVEGCRVILSEPGAIVTESITDADGRVEFSQGYRDEESFTVAAVKTGTTVAMHINGESIVTGFEGEQNVRPEGFALLQNYPNPFNPTTTIAFDLRQTGLVEISIHNLLGQTVRTLTDGLFTEGRHEVIWDGSNNSGQPVASGIYFYRMKAERFVSTRKMVLLR